MEQSPRNLSAYETATKPAAISKKLISRSALPGIQSPFSVCAECGPQSRKRKQRQAPPPICVATRNEFLRRNARATRFGNLDLAPSACTLRSEERRVGKECRSRWAT